MTANELEVLEHYKRKIVKYIDAPEVLLKCLGKLDQVRVNIDLLGVGFNVILLHGFYVLRLEDRHWNDCQRSEEEIRRLGCRSFIP